MRQVELINTPDNMLIPGETSTSFKPGLYDLVQELPEYYIITNGSELKKLHKSRFANPGNDANLIHTHEANPNTFYFYVQLGEGYHMIKVKQFTDFTGTALAEDFPNGSWSTYTGTAPLHCKTPEDCVNWVAQRLLANWQII